MRQALAIYLTLCVALSGCEGGGELPPLPSEQFPSESAPSAPRGSASPRRQDTAGRVPPPLARMRSNPLRYTRHARCRMRCRDISEAEVQAILQRDGQIDASRTRGGQGPDACTSYALQGRTGDGQDVRIVYGDCQDAALVITAIDLGEEHPCDCE